MGKNKTKTNDTTIKDITNLFRLEKENKVIKDRILRDIRNVYRLEKENTAIKDIILKDTRNLFENEEKQNYYKPVRSNNFSSNNYIKYKSNCHRNKIS